MITINLESIKINLEEEAEKIEMYEEPLNHRHRCPLCGGCDLVRNGTYERNVIYIAEGRLKCRRITMQRYLCKSCGKTRSHMPDFLVRNREYAISTLMWISINGLSKKRLSGETDIPESQIKKTRKAFKEIRKRIGSIRFEKREITVNDLIEKYAYQFCEKPFESYQRGVPLMSLMDGIYT